MPDNNSPNLDKLDWENFKFPLILSNIKTQNGIYKLNKDARITIWRDEEFKLTGHITGTINRKEDLVNKSISLDNNNTFPDSETIICTGSDKYTYIIRDCLIFLESYKIDKDTKKLNFKAKLKLRNIIKEKENNKLPYKIIDWHLSSKYGLKLPRITKRYINSYPYKYRDTIENSSHDNNNDSTIHSITRDHLILHVHDLTIIIQVIDKKYLPEWAGGIAIEYIKVNSLVQLSSTRAAVAEFISFIFGANLILVGTTAYNAIGIPMECSCHTPSDSNPIKSCEFGRMPPTILTERIQSSDVEITLSKLLYNYLVNREKYELDDVLWKLNVGKVQLLGANLPILASGIEILAENYLKVNEIITNLTKSEKKKYIQLIQDELLSLENKLKDYKFCDFVVNRLKHPSNYGIGEKLSLFFNELGFIINNDSIESKALLARNKMSHSSVSRISEAKAKSFIRYAAVYINLYHRIILKILQYDGTYIDHYSNNFPNRKLNENIPTS